MSRVIPKEQLTAYQRWELAAFDGDPHNGPARQTAEPPQEPVEKMALPTAEDLERLHQEAWREGHDLGKAEGYQAGLAEGRQDAAEQTRRLRALADLLEGGRLRQDEALARETLALALVVAQQVVRRAFMVQPELLLDGIREALLSLPALNGHHKIIVHPDHVEMVQTWLGHEHGHLSWKVLADPRLEPGAFRFESAYSELDGTLTTRWQEIAECLGADGKWLS
ncbi:MAG: flagellar assembly protein FliH [Pseudomonadota bacterium]